jgi:bifunctional DNase/RNase
MLTELVQIRFHKIMQTRAYTVIILGTSEKQFAIYTEPNVGKILQMHLTDASKPRPVTHDLIAMLFQGFDMRIKQVVINDIQDTVYFARLFVEQFQQQIQHIVEVDARPSDCITLALLSNAPVYCTKEVLDKALPIEAS